MVQTPDDLETVRKLVKYIQENLRAGATAGLKYIDLKNHRSQALAFQNHVVFGRRGAGKSTLIRSIAGEAGNSNIVVVQSNMEDFKDVSFPDIIIQVLLSFLGQCAQQLPRMYVRKFRVRRKARRAVSTLVRQLERILEEPDSYEAEERLLSASATRVAGQVNAVSGEIGARRESESKRQITVQKLSTLRRMLPTLKGAIASIDAATGASAIFLVLDDFYFIDKDTQPHFIDYFHRLSKDTPLFIKVATIRHRSKLYANPVGQYLGVELNHDVFPIDLDYTLDDFNELKRFMGQLLQHLAGAVNRPYEWLEGLFRGDGFSQLCLASGGVPRDFLALLSHLLTRLAEGSIERIGKVDVTEVAIASATAKQQAFQTDSAAEREVLHRYLQWIKEQVIGKHKRNTFLVAKPDLERYPPERQAIRELTDLRFIHLVNTNTSSAPSDGRRYEAYMVDVGLYDNARPQNFEQIDPAEKDDKSRQDRLRASPRLSLEEMSKVVQGHTVLRISDE